MSTSNRLGWSVSLRAAILLAAFVVLAGPAGVFGQDPATPVVRVEEDWLLWVYEPDGAAACPQFHTIMSPLPDTRGNYFMVTWNYWELPQFSPGGFQVQNCDGDTVLDTNGVADEELTRFAEVITWTQVMETDGSQLGFAIMNGNSITWGYFGYPETVIVGDSGVDDLSRYSPDVSVANAAITYGRNRVIMLCLRGVRYYSADGLVKEDTTRRYVYRLNQPQ